MRQFVLMKPSPVLNQPNRYLGELPASLLVARNGNDFESNLRKLEAKTKSPYSLSRAIKGAMPGERLSGLELECHEELAGLMPRNSSGAAVRIPASALDIRQRDLSVTGGAGTGGELVQTTIRPPIIPFLRAKSITGRAGATLLTDLTGDNLQLPRATGTGGAVWLPEIGQATNAEATFDKIVVSPKRILGYSIVSRQLVVQSIPSVDAFVANELSAAIATAVDAAAIYGSGSGGQPLGLVNLPVNAGGQYSYDKTQSVTFAGAASRNSLLDFVIALENGLIQDDGSFSFVTSPTVRDKLARAEVVPNYPTFVWDKNPDAIDGFAAGYRLIASPQIIDNRVILAKWSELLIFTWLGAEVLVNPITKAPTAEVEIFVTSFVDIAFRYASAFVISSDSGAQLLGDRETHAHGHKRSL
jgi:hypothetical protein